MADGIHLTNEETHLTLQGSNNVSCVVESTTNFTNWTPISTGFTTSNRLEFIDSAATNFLVRFYRAREQ